jgi:hypothetical protein
MSTLPDMTLPSPDLARALAAEGMPPDEVERAITAQRPWLDAEHRAALWLLAWCTDRGDGRTVAWLPPGG